MTIRKTPILFLRRLVIIEFFFAFLPLLAVLIFPLQAEYNQTGLSEALSYNVLLTVVVTTLQISIISISFFSWYLPEYQLDSDHILSKRVTALTFRELIPFAEIQQVEIRQGWLGKRLDYGNLRLSTVDTGRVVSLTDIPNPIGTAHQIERQVAEQRQITQPAVTKQPDELLAEGEGQYVEFKSSILWDYRQQQMNKNLSAPIIKSVAAFMNTAGGTLLIGINDEGEVLGLDADFQVMKKPNPDGFELMFNNAFNQMVGIEFRPFVKLSFPEIEGNVICIATVQPANRPVYFRQKGREEFYIRAGNASQPLPVSKAATYIRDRFE
jgi:membrane protein YdbS with pleckstrin-like domain